jgi:ketosteroid isomerase-like protein
MSQTMRPTTGNMYRLVLGFLLCAAIFLGSTIPAGAQQKDKKNKKDTPAPSTTPASLASDEQQIDNVISTMLGAWQVNDIEKLHETYAEDVVIVSGAWSPPVLGWANYAPVYQQQRGRMQQVRMERSNTLIKIVGTFAWACYQWDFSAAVDGRTSESLGQTTLVFEKRNGHWLIVHNHTSLVQTASPGSAPPAAQQPPSKPASR